MYCAIEQGHFEVAKLLIERGAEIHAKNCYGTTPLHWAAILGQSDIVSYLLNQGADINSRDGSGHSALFLAVVERHTATAKVLIERGCNDKSLLVIAAAFGLTEVSKLLFDRGLYDPTDNRYRVICYSEKPLRVAVFDENSEVVAFFLE